MGTLLNKDEIQLAYPMLKTFLNLVDLTNFLAGVYHLDQGVFIFSRLRMKILQTIKLTNIWDLPLQPPS